MPDLAYGTSAYSRAYGSLPPLTLINLYVESAKTSSGGVCLQSRPGMTESFTAGSGPVTGMFAKAGTFGGDLFTLSDLALYREQALLGSIAGTGASRFAGGYDEVLVTRGGTLYSYNGTDLVDSGFTGDASNSVTSVCFINSSFVAIEANSARFFWSAPLDGRDWDVLHFATAEREPDALLDCARLGNNLWLFGQNTVEAWADGGDATARFTSIPSVLFDKGIRATGCVTDADNSLFFISEDSLVYRIGEVPEPISDFGIVEKIAASATARLFSFWQGGHEFVAVRLDAMTLLYDCSTQQWCEFQTDGGNWAAAHAAMKGGEAYLGHGSTGQVMVFDGWDDLGDELLREFTAATELTQGVPFDNLILWANAGQTDVLSGQGSDPVVELQTSSDAGNTWTDFDGAPLGAAGDYRTIPEWRRLGMFDFPGMMARFRVTDPVPFRVSGVKVNEPLGGRSR